MSTKKTKLVMYTQPKCYACIEAKEELQRNKIDFEEKNVDIDGEFEEEFDQLSSIIGCWFTPTLVHKGGHILVSGRDFQGAEQIPSLLKAYDSISGDSDGFITLERLKTFESETKEALEYIVETIQEFKEFKDEYTSTS